MRVFLISLALWGFAVLSAQAQSSALQSLETGNDARGWEAVGRLDIDGKGFCTGTLISEDLVLTAAHCMFETNGGPAVDLSRIEFRAGLRNGRPEATRRVRNAVVHPQYPNDVDTHADSVRYDVALVQLDRPIRPSQIEPFEISSSLSNGVEIGVVSYAQDRAESPSLQEVCNVLGEQNGTLVMSCEIDFGASGSPVFRNESGVPRLVSVFSAMVEIDGETVSLGTDLAAPIATLRAALEDGVGLFATPPSSARVTRPGERADTGALFVRP
jgi:V8-like Glu-specific endopeptidase